MSYVKLIYFEGCPEAKNVRAALLNAGIYDFEVILQNNLPAGNEYRNFSSPSVLSGMELVYGIRTNDEISSCTFDTINFVDEGLLVKRFREIKSQIGMPKKGIKSFFSAFLTILIVLKCPACIPSLVAFLSTLGLTFFISQAAIKSIFVILLMLSMAGLFVSFKVHRNLIPLMGVLVFSIALYLGRFHPFDSFINPFLVYVSITGLICALLCDLWLKTRRPCAMCK